MRDAEGPDLPPPHEGFSLDAWAYRWPTGTEKCELVDGVPVFYGDFDERDVEIARRAYPGRRIVLHQDGVLEVHPGEPSDEPVEPQGDLDRH
ncbi:MAG: hypothetical protein HOV94_28195 [Saccharothrix sp.]|nr:hypothetical protein [Saccharothrix sp.]